MKAPGFFFAVLLWGGSAATLAAPPAYPQLEVEHTAFVLRQPNGQVLRGTQLEGRVVQLLDGLEGSGVQLLFASDPSPLTVRPAAFGQRI